MSPSDRGALAMDVHHNILRQLSLALSILRFMSSSLHGILERNNVSLLFSLLQLLLVDVIFFSKLLCM